MNLKELAKAKGTNLKKVAERCGVPASTLYAISCGDTTFDNVGIGLFMKIADALDMTSEDLYRANGGYDAADIADKAPSELTPAEWCLIDAFRACDAAYKDMLVKSAIAYAAMTKKNGAGDSKDADMAAVKA